MLQVTPCTLYYSPLTDGGWYVTNTPHDGAHRLEAVYALVDTKISTLNVPKGYKRSGVITESYNTLGEVFVPGSVPWSGQQRLYRGNGWAIFRNDRNHNDYWSS